MSKPMVKFVDTTFFAMKSISYALITTFASLLLYSCKPEIELAIQNNNDKAEISYENDFVYAIVSNTGIKLDFSLDSRYPWEIEQPKQIPDWLKVSPTYGKKGETSFGVSVLQNTTYEDRIATIVLTSKKYKKTIRIQQLQKNWLASDTKLIVLPQQGGLAIISLESNTDYSISIDSDAATWITSTETKGMTTTQLGFNVADNEERSARGATVTIYGKNVTEKIRIIQQGTKPLFPITDNTIDVPCYPYDFDLYCPEPATLEIPPEQTEWLSTTEQTSAPRLIWPMHATENKDNTKRTISLSFSTIDNGFVTNMINTTISQSATTLAVLRIGLEADSFTNPELEGSDPYYYIEYGDGTKETNPIPASIHSYDGSRPRTVTCTTYNASAIWIQNMKGINSLDLRDFLRDK